MKNPWWSWALDEMSFWNTPSTPFTWSPEMAAFFRYARRSRTSPGTLPVRSHSTGLRMGWNMAMYTSGRAAACISTRSAMTWKMYGAKSSMSCCSTTSTTGKSAASNFPWVAGSPDPYLMSAATVSNAKWLKFEFTGLLQTARSFCASGSMHMAAMPATCCSRNATTRMTHFMTYSFVSDSGWLKAPNSAARSGWMTEPRSAGAYRRAGPSRCVSIRSTQIAA